MKPTYEELQAQVEVLRRDNLSLLEYAADAERWFNLHDPNGYISPKRESAKACLAQVKADAGRAGWVMCAETMNDACTNMDDVWSERQITEAANEYAERIRKEGA